MVFGEGGVVVDQVGGGRSGHFGFVHRKSSSVCSSQVSVEQGRLGAAGAVCSTGRRCIGYLYVAEK